MAQPIVFGSVVGAVLVLGYRSLRVLAHVASHQTAYDTDESTDDDEDGTADSQEAPEARDPYAILGVQRGASHGEIHAAYIRLMSEYHPDKVANLGPELRALATRKTQEINAAYQEVVAQTQG